MNDTLETDQLLVLYMTLGAFLQLPNGRNKSRMKALVREGAKTLDQDSTRTHEAGDIHLSM
jgi:hypothetical protein